VVHASAKPFSPFALPFVAPLVATAVAIVTPSVRRVRWPPWFLHASIMTRSSGCDIRDQPDQTLIRQRRTSAVPDAGDLPGVHAGLAERRKTLTP
jgi:hypothetical protein